MSIGLCNIFRPFSPRSSRRYAVMNGIWLCAPSFDPKVPKTIYHFSRRRNVTKHRSKAMRRLGLRTAVPKTALSVFDVDEMIPRINRRLNVDLVTSEHTNPAGWPRGTEPLCPFVTLSKRGIEPLRLYNTVYLRARRTSVSGVNPNGRQKMPAFFEGMGISFDTAGLRSACY